MRIGFVDLTKLVFAFIVCFYHFFNVVSPNPYFPLGNLTVELFVLIAGVFFFLGIEKQLTRTAELQSPYAFLKKRFLRFLPYSLAGFMLAFAVKFYLEYSPKTGISLGTLGSWLSDGLWEILMIKMNGMNNNQSMLNVPAWTLSAMLISEFFAYACFYNSKKLYTTLIAPLSIVIGLGVWRHIPKASHQLWMGYTTFGVFRVWLLYCLSWYCCQLMIRIKETPWTKSGKAFLTVSEFFCYAFSLLIIVTQTTRNYRWAATLLLFAAAAISISGRSASASMIRSKKLIFWIGELSMGVYLTHYPIMQVFRAWYPGRAVLDHFAVFVCVVIAAAAAFAVSVVYAKSLFAVCYRKITSKLIAAQPSEKL